MQSLVLQFLVTLSILKFFYLILNSVVTFHQLIHASETGESVSVEDEVVVINSIVLPNKTLNLSVQEEIIL